MQTDSSIHSTLRSLDAAAIERELNAFWEDAGKETEQEGVARACVLNLIVFTPAAQATSALDETLSEISIHHPSRIILIAADRTAADSALEAQTLTRCAFQPGAGKQVCGEQITIHAKGTQVNELHSAVAPLLLSDLPIYLWWHDAPPLADKAFTRLAEMSNRVIIDSASFADPQGDLIALALLLRERPKWTAITDLNWARLTAWRALIAGFYDIAEYRPALSQVNRLVIEYAPPASAPEAISPRALLIAGWIAARLGWRQDRVRRDRPGGAVTFEFLTGTQRIFIELKRTSRATIEPGHLAQVTLKADSFAEEAADASFTVTKSDEGTRLKTTINIGYEARVGRVLSYVKHTESELIGRELEILSRDRVYEQAVGAAGEMLVAYAQL
ncbi:MAG TPA: glucose-6-phosphate dehydrogenase assembly protein OpcA [Blastocatellia bacterium]|nr:glucose-6-phosphate dehydrogenase assembly protein OpcA [Blastocatellia bacterium]